MCLEALAGLTPAGFHDHQRRTGASADVGLGDRNSDTRVPKALTGQMLEKLL